MKKLITLLFIFISITGYNQELLKLLSKKKAQTNYAHKDSVITLNAIVDYDNYLYSKAQVDSFQYIFTMHMEGGAIASPVDATTYYIGSIFIQAPTSLYGNRYITIPNNCTLYAYSANILATGAASAETYSIYVRVNDSSDHELSSGFNVHTTGGFSRMFNSSSLNISLSAGDKIAIKIVTPTWETNPTALIHSFVLFFKTSKL